MMMMAMMNGKVRVSITLVVRHIARTGGEVGDG